LHQAVEPRAPVLAAHRHDGEIGREARDGVAVAALIEAIRRSACYAANCEAMAMMQKGHSRLSHSGPLVNPLQDHPKSLLRLTEDPVRSTQGSFPHVAEGSIPNVA